MLDELNPAECLAKVNTTFLVGDVRTTLTGCDALASVHIGSYLNGDEMANMTMSYFSHSIKEFLFNIKNLPDVFANGTATHQCLIPKIQFTTHEDTQYPTIYTNPGLFTARTRPGQVIANATEKFFIGTIMIFMLVSLFLPDSLNVRPSGMTGSLVIRYKIRRMMYIIREILQSSCLN